MNDTHDEKHLEERVAAINALMPKIAAAIEPAIPEGVHYAVMAWHGASCGGCGGAHAVGGVSNAPQSEVRKVFTAYISQQPQGNRADA